MLECNVLTVCRYSKIAIYTFEIIQSFAYMFAAHIQLNTTTSPMHEGRMIALGTHIVMVDVCCAGMNNAVVVQQLNVARLQHVVHSQLYAVGQILNSLQGSLLQVCQLRHVLMSGGRPDEAVLKVGDQIALHVLSHEGQLASTICTGVQGHCTPSYCNMHMHTCDSGTRKQEQWLFVLRYVTVSMK